MLCFKLSVALRCRAFNSIIYYCSAFRDNKIADASSPQEYTQIQSAQRITYLLKMHFPTIHEVLTAFNFPVVHFANNFEFHF